jgi:hypothetical protein
MSNALAKPLPRAILRVADCPDAIHKPLLSCFRANLEQTCRTPGLRLYGHTLMFAKFCLLSVFLCFCSAAQVNTETDFDVVKTLQGIWKIETEGKPLGIEMSYEGGSKQSIVTERFGKELSVFYRNGQSVEMVHFCNAGNQPRLRLKEASQPGGLDFKMFAITNLSTRETPHVQEVIYKLVDPNTTKLEIVWWPKTRGSEKYTLTRIRDGQ